MAKPVTAKKRRKRNIELKSVLDLNKSTGDKIAIWLANFLGSITFLLVCVSLVVFYFLWNLGFLPGLHPFDSYPYGILSVVLSTFAIVLSISVLIGQNRQRKIEKVRERVEFEVNVRAETEITKMLEMLHGIQRKLGINKPDEELEEMKESLDLGELHKNLGESNDNE